MTNIQDSAAYTELYFFVTNTREVYDNINVPIIKNLEKHYKKGNYNKDSAFKSIERMIDRANNLYKQWHGHKFDKKIVKALIPEIHDSIYGEIEIGNYLG